MVDSLGHLDYSGLDFATEVHCYECRCPTSLIEKTKQIMIRHTKSQRIHGSDALALPELNVETVMLNMTEEEKANYIQQKKLDKYYTNKKRSIWNLRMDLINRLRAASSFQSKINALLNDLASLRLTEPHLHAVIFTNESKNQVLFASALKAKGYSVTTFSTKVTIKQRHECIRKFQAFEKNGPKIIVTSIAIGSVGVTLTAASRVYLMEPW